jgi:ribose transport system substrate-binding protein
MFKMTRTIRLLVITMLLVAAFPVGAASVSADDTSQAFTIGLVLPNLNSPFFEGMVAGAQEAADQNAVDLVVSVADDDIDAELANVEALIEQPVDAIVFRPVDPELSVPAYQAAVDAGVPVVLVGDLTLDPEADQQPILITGNDLDGGKLAAETMCTDLEQAGTVLELVGAPDAATADRNTGFEDYMAESCTGVTLVPFETADMDADALKTALTDTFRATPPDGVFAYDSATTQAALEASILSRTKGLTFIGYGVSEDTLAAVKMYQLRALITPSPWLLGGSGVETSLALLNGEDVLSSVDVALAVLDSAGFEDFRFCSRPPCRH